MQMSERILGYRWEQIRRDAPDYWGKLTEADLDHIGGDFARFVHVLHHRYGYWLVKAEDELKDFLYRYQDVPASLLRERELTLDPSAFAGVSN